MKKTLFILGAILLLVSCDKELNGEIEMKLGEKRSNEDISLKVSEIMDNRCPKEVDCFIAGWYEVTFTISNAQEELNFVLGSDNGLSSDTVIFDHKITLTDVTPYPVQGDDAKDKKVHLKINKQ